MDNFAFKGLITMYIIQILFYVYMSNDLKSEIPSYICLNSSASFLVQQSLPSADPLTGGHLPWADIFPMYELLSNLIQPLMNGHLLNADRDSA